MRRVIDRTGMPTGVSRLWIWAALAIASVLMPATATLARAQTLETETARLLRRGMWELASNFEVQSSKEGREYAVPLAVEYGLTNRLELLVEPVAYTAIRPKTGPRATGAGDIEVTLTALAWNETATRPAIAFAGEVKIPTAHSRLIGTGKTDVAGYIIASRHFGRLDSHANVGYTIVGHPVGVKLQNIVNGALGWEYELSARNSFFGEVLGNTASVAEGDSPTAGGGVLPEAPAGEVVGTVGIARLAAPGLKLSLGVSYDNSKAVMLRPGLIWYFR